MFEEKWFGIIKLKKLEFEDTWSDGYDNVVVCCTIENQKNADRKLSVFQTLPITGIRVGELV